MRCILGGAEYVGASRFTSGNPVGLVDSISGAAGDCGLVVLCELPMMTVVRTNSTEARAASWRSEQEKCRQLMSQHYSSTQKWFVNMEMETSCPICLTDFQKETCRRISFSTCTHQFCFTCIEKFLKKNDALPFFGKCPLCRKDVSLFDARDGDSPVIPMGVSHLASHIRKYSGEDTIFAFPDEFNRTYLDGSRLLHLTLEDAGKPSIFIDDCATEGTRKPVQKYQFVSEPIPCLYLRLADDAHRFLVFSTDFTLVTRFAVISEGCVNVKNYHRTSGFPMTRQKPLVEDVAIFQPSERKLGTMLQSCFIQSNLMGLASYHFVAENDCYIHYGDVARAMFPKLDNGAPIPRKIQFRDISIEGQVFRGTIAWLLDCGTTWHGCERWRYEMQFSSDFVTITGGHVLSKLQGRNDETNMSTFGVDLHYRNYAAEMERLGNILRESVLSSFPGAIFR